jgi:hypothetical protein
MYSKIYDFCRVKNSGSANLNKHYEFPPRVNFLIDLVSELGIAYEVDSFPIGETLGYNIILRGTSGNAVSAHHDILNPHVDNANDNSCSVINAIALKLKVPEITVFLLDAEEIGGLGAKHAAQKIKSGEFGKIDWVLNLELSGKGGANFFIGDYPGKLSNQIIEKFKCPIVSTPFNDAVIFRQNGIDSVVINPLPILSEGKVSQVKYGDNYLDFSMLSYCHSSMDSIGTIDVGDMQKFVEEVLVEIVK